MMTFFSRFFIIFIVLTMNSLLSAKTTNIAISSTPTNLSPFFSVDSNSQNINRLTHISLTDFNEKMQFQCHLCNKYQEIRTKEGYSIRFSLRSDVQFWDGSPVTAYDVQKSHKYFTDEKTIKSIFRFAFGKIKKIIVHAKYDVELFYEKFSLEHMSNLSLFKIIKLDGVINSKNEIIKAPELANIIGAGPYKLGNVSDLAVELKSINKKNKDLDFKVVKDETTLAFKLLKKEVDISLANISPRKYKWLKKKKNSGLLFHESAGTNYQYIGINHTKNHLKSRKIRKALSLLIPRKKILKEKLKDTAVLATGMFSKSFAAMHTKKDIDKYDSNMASKLFKEEGYIKNSKGLYEKNGKVFGLNWIVTSNKASIEMVSTIKSYYKKFGISVKVSTQEWGSFMNSFKSGQYDILIAQWVGFTGPEMLEAVFHSSRFSPKGINRGHYSNANFDKIIDMASVETDPMKRIELYRNAEKTAFDDYAYINLWHPNIIWAARSCVSGLNLMPNGSFYPLLKMKNECKK